MCTKIDNQLSAWQNYFDSQMDRQPENQEDKNINSFKGSNMDRLKIKEQKDRWILFRQLNVQLARKIEDQNITQIVYQLVKYVEARNL